MSEHSIKAIRQQFKERGVFYTPPELALFLKSLIPGSPDRVYDPTCGRGSLLSVFEDEVQKFGQDIDPLAISDARESLSNFTGAVGDLFTEPAWLDERFSAIVANPPFSVKWEPQADERFMYAPTVPTAGKADYAFLLHILHMLSDDGVAAVINFPGVGYRGNREGQIRRWMVEQNYIDQVIHIPGDTFTDTKIATLCIVLRKNRVTQTIRFVDREHELEREVTFDEVEKNDFALSVSSYVQRPKPQIEPFDSWGTEQAARSHMIKKLRADILFSKQVAEFENWSIEPFLDDLDQVINDYRREFGVAA